MNDNTGPKWKQVENTSANPFQKDAPSNETKQNEATASNEHQASSPKTDSLPSKESASETSQFGSKGLLLVLLVLIAVLGVIIAVWIFLPKNQEKADKSNSDTVESNDQTQVTDNSQEELLKNSTLETAADMNSNEIVSPDADPSSNNDTSDVYTPLWNYMGKWGIGNSNERELTILYADEERVDFSLFYYRLSYVENVSASVKGNTAVFSDFQDSMRFSGKLSFEDSVIRLTITQSDYPYMSPEEMVFDTRIDNSGNGYGSGTSQNTYEMGVVFPNSSELPIDSRTIESLTNEELRYAINELYARKGYIFRDEELTAYYERFSWYIGTIPADQFSLSYFNDVELANLDLLQRERDTRKKNGTYNY